MAVSELVAASTNSLTYTPLVGGAAPASEPTLTLVVTDGASTPATVTTSTPTWDTDHWDVTITAANVPTSKLWQTWTFTWTWVYGGNTYADTEYADVVSVATGPHLFSIAELRTFDTALTAANYPGATVNAARARAESVIENAARCAFVTRTETQTLSGYDSLTAPKSGYYRLLLKWPKCQTLTSVTVDGTAMSAADLADVHLREWGALDNENSWDDGVDNVVAVYTHGFSDTPEPVKRAALMLARYYTVPSALPDRAVGEATDVGFLRYTLAGRDGVTGIPEVDAIIAQYGRVGRCIG